jgi:glycosyltransferase involved in cell wall biosynthesis
MNHKIKVNLFSKNHSTGRGVGIYANNLREHLSKINNLELSTENPDIIHYPFFDLFYKTLPIIKNKKTIVTIHDVTPLVLEKLYPKGLKGNLNLIHQKIALKNVSAIITDSQNSKEDLINYLSVPRDKIHVVYLAADKSYLIQPKAEEIKKIVKKYQLPEKFILTVPGGPNPNKNLPLLAKATKELDLPLVIVGSAFTNKDLINNLHPELNDLRNLRQYSHIIYPGFVPTQELVSFYCVCSLYCLPSLYEGFGLPLLEAMSTGCLLVSSNTSSLPEIYPKETITFDPSSLSSLTEALKQALSLKPEKKKAIIESGKNKLKEFSWEKTAKETFRIYQKVYNS